MSDPQLQRDAELTNLLDEAQAELRTSGRLDLDAWRQRHPERVGELIPLLETLQDLNTVLGEPGAPGTVTGPDRSSQAEEPLPERIGRYRVVARVGGGGMGTVYKAHDPQLDRVVAVKVPRFDPQRDDTVAVQRFLREARAAAKVRHPHVCPISDVGEHDGLPFVVMAFVEGQSLADRLKSEGRCADPREAVVLVRQVAEAREAVHAPGAAAAAAAPLVVAAAAVALVAAGAALLAGQIIIRLKGNDGKVTEVTVPEGSKVGIDDKGNVHVELLGDQKRPPDGAGPEPADGKSGEPLSPGALVQRPARLPGLRGWTIDTRGNRYNNQLRPILSPDGRLLATGSWDGSIRITDAETGDLVKLLHGHTEILSPYGNNPYVVAWSADGKSLASHSRDHTLRVWDVATGRLRQTFTDMKEDVHGQPTLAWSPDGKRLAANFGASVWVVDLSTGERLHSFPANGDFA